MPVRYILSSVWVRLSIFSQLSIIQYVGLCVFSWPIPLVMTERIYILCLIIIIKSEVWTNTHCLGLGHETMVCHVCLSIFLSRNTHCSGSRFRFPNIKARLSCDHIYWKDNSFILGRSQIKDKKWTVLKSKSCTQPMMTYSVMSLC